MSGGMLPFIGPNGFPQWAHLSEFLSTSHFLSVPGYTQACPDCRGTLVASETMPEFECASCGKIVPVPSGDEILMQDLIDLHKQTVAGQ